MSRRVNNIAIIETEEPQTCTGCGALKECRPYGKNGAQVCYACAMATPESQAEADKQMAIRLFGELN